MHRDARVRLAFPNTRGDAAVVRRFQFDELGGRVDRDLHDFASVMSVTFFTLSLDAESFSSIAMIRFPISVFMATLSSRSVMTFSRSPKSFSRYFHASAATMAGTLAVPRMLPSQSMTKCIESSLANANVRRTGPEGEHEEDEREHDDDHEGGRLERRGHVRLDEPQREHDHEDRDQQSEERHCSSEC